MLFKLYWRTRSSVVLSFNIKDPMEKERSNACQTLTYVNLAENARAGNWGFVASMRPSDWKRMKLFTRMRRVNVMIKMKLTRSCH